MVDASIHALSLLSERLVFEFTCAQYPFIYLCTDTQVPYTLDFIIIMHSIVFELLL